MTEGLQIGDLLFDYDRFGILIEFTKTPYNCKVFWFDSGEYLHHSTHNVVAFKRYLRDKLNND